MKFAKNIQLLLTTLGQFRNRAFVLLGIIFMVSVTESAGLWMILPVLELILNPEVIQEGSFTFLMGFLELFEEDNYLLVVCAIFFVVILIKSVFAFLQNYYMMKFTTDMQRYWETTILDNYLHSRFEVLAEETHGKLLNNILNEPVLSVKAIRQSIDFMSKIILSSFILVVVFSVNWQITISLLAIIGLLLFFFWRTMSKYSNSVGKKKIVLNQSINSLVSEFLHGIRQIKIFSVENKAVSQFRGKLEKLFRMLVIFSVISKSPKIIGEFIMFAVLILVILYNQYIAGAEVSAVLPMLGFFLVSFQKLFANLSTLVSQRMSILSYIPSLKLVDSIIKDKSSIESLDGVLVPSSFQGGLVFNQVSFSYGRDNVFDNLSFEIKKGEITALVGASGSGKSTICELITRFYTPTSGQILSDGVDINAYDLKSWRNSIGYISQEAFLFDGSIRDNVMVGKDSATDEEFNTALMNAQASEFVQNMPDTHNTKLGNSGVNISGGQRQRLSIARALIRSSKFLILDESTSSLDSESEGKIMSFIDACKGDKTVLIITHNLLTLRNVDQIHVFNSGKVVESGCYTDLIENNGLFEKLAKGKECNEPELA